MRLLFKRPRKLRHPHWRVPCTCLPPLRSATLSSSRVLGPASCPQAGGGEREGGGRDRISLANGTVPTGFGSPVNIPHSIPLPHLQASANNPESLLATEQQPPTHEHSLTGTRHVHSKGLQLAVLEGTLHGHFWHSRPSDTTPHNLQMVPKVAICNPF